MFFLCIVKKKKKKKKKKELNEIVKFETDERIRNPYFSKK